MREVNRGQMKGFTLYAPGDIRISEWPIPVIEDDEILIRTAAVGICGSDVHAFHGLQPSMTYPVIIGHEISGVIEKIGALVEDLAEGDHVVVDPVIKCGTCNTCSSGKSNICCDLKVLGVHVHGGMAEYVKIKDYQAHKVPKELPLWKAAFAEPLSIGGQAVTRGKICEGDNVLVIGSGPIGLSVLAMAKAKGANVAIVDKVRARLDKALAYGADKVIDPAIDDISSVSLKMTDGAGMDVVIDAVGAQNVLDDAVKCVKRGGNIVVLGLAPPEVGVSALAILKKELNVFGSRMSYGQFESVIDLISQGRIDTGTAITQRFMFHEIHKAFELALHPNSGVMKIIVEMC